MTIKKREKTTAPEVDIAAKIESFASGADGGPPAPASPTAKHDFKAMRVPLNQFEYEQLEAGARLSGRSKLNFIRYAMLKLAKEMQSEQV